MSVRLCAAAIALVVIGGLAVNAYQDQPPEPVSKAELLQQRIRELDRQLQSPKGDIEKRTIGIELAANKEALQIIEDRYARAVDRLKISELQALVRMLQDNMKAMQNKTSTLASADKPQPARTTPGGTTTETPTKEIRKEGRDVPVPEIPNIVTPPSSSPVGRFQFVDRGTLKDGMKFGLMIDTTTGKCWHLFHERWQELASPASLPADVKLGAAPVLSGAGRPGLQLQDGSSSVLPIIPGDERWIPLPTVESYNRYQRSTKEVQPQGGRSPLEPPADPPALPPASPPQNTLPENFSFPPPGPLKNIAPG